MIMKQKYTDLMNLRNILISAVALGSLLCTSCSNELADIPEKQPETGLTEGRSEERRVGKEC